MRVYDGLQMEVTEAKREGGFEYRSLVQNWIYDHTAFSLFYIWILNFPFPFEQNKTEVYVFIAQNEE